jgi:transaldolase
MESKVQGLSVELFADGADLAGIVEMAGKPFISGLTTNPTLMKKAGVTNYVKFAKDVLREVTDKPISFEVFADELEDMKKQGEKISSWGSNVFVKVPVTNTRGVSTQPVIRYLAMNGVKVNVTALMTIAQVNQIAEALNPKIDSYISIFAGRIADTGRDPLPIIKDCIKTVEYLKNCKVIWASPRELLNVFQANENGCHIITATSDILKKLDLVDYDLTSYSLDTVKMFYQDALSAGYSLD